MDTLHGLRSILDSALHGNIGSLVPARLPFCTTSMFQTQASPGSAVLGIRQEGLDTMTGVRGSSATERRERERDAANAASAACSAGRPAVLAGLGARTQVSQLGNHLTDTQICIA